MKSERKFSYLIKNTFLYTISSFASIILSFLLVPLYTNVLSPSEYSIAEVISTGAMLLMYCMTMNISASVLRFGIDRNEKVDRVLLYGIKVHVVGTFLAAIVVYTFMRLNLVDWPYYCYPFILLVFFFDSLQTIFYSYLRAIDKVKVCAIASFLSTIMRLVTNLLTLLVFKWGLLGYLISLVSGPFIGLLYSVTRILPVHISNKNYLYDNKLHKRMRNYAIPTIANQMAWWINNNLDKYYVLVLQGANQTGIYALSYKLPGVMNILCTIFGQAWGISAIKEFDREDRDHFFATTYRIYHFILVISCSILILFNIPISKLLYAKAFFEAYKYSSILMMAMLFSGLSTYFGGILNAVKKTKVFAATTILNALMNITFNTILIPIYGVMGAAVATMISFHIAWLSRLIASRKYVKVKINLAHDYLIYMLLILQIIFERYKNHLYIGQVIIFIVIMILNFKKVSIVLSKRLFSVLLKKDK
jgi:O-antigen/teichoic acid export membrane protein